MNKPKIVIIGAGSLFFGRKLIWSMNHLEGLTSGHLSLVDTDPEHLELMRQLAEKAKASSGAGYTVSGSADYRDELEGADFVILSFSRENAKNRGIDVQISAKHGIRMCSGDTIGPGGVFRALREFPKIMEIVKAVEEICPEAWLINYINPSSVFGIAMMRHCRTPNFALCDSLHLPYLHRSYMKMLGIDEGEEKDFSMRIAGVNHFTWLLEATHKGEDVLPRIREALRELGEQEDPEAAAKAVFNKRISAKLSDFFGAVPVCTGHTKEYVPYFQGYGPHVEAEIVPPLKLFEHETRAEITRGMWKEIAEYNAGERPMEEFHQNYRSDHATDIIQAIWNDSGRRFFVNLPNQGAVPNLPDDAFLELECVCGKEGPKAIPAPEMPLGLRGLQMQILDTHELTVEAYMKKDRNLLLRALATDPIVNSLAAAEKVLEDLYEAEKDDLEDWIAPSAQGEQRELAGMAKADTVEQGQTREGR